DLSMWDIIYHTNDAGYVNIKNDDPKSGNCAGHFWSESAMSFEISQTVTGLEPGKYALKANIQGGDASQADMKLMAITKDNEQVSTFKVDGWLNWQTPTISTINVTDGTVTITMKVDAPAKAWGTFDDFELIKLD
ncbi:MAG TPA: hypothetical protein DCY20_09850, partial [Firmicutes bacterium]|nr:hypothetical protein [Bacillota bacterium]